MSDSPPGPALGRSAAMRAVLRITGSTYLNYASGLLVSAMAARALGPTEYGHYAYLVWLSGLVNMLANHGLTGTAIRFISESIGAGDTGSARRLHAWLLLRQRVSLLLVGLAFLLALPLLRPSGWQENIAVFAAAVLISAAAKSSHLFASSVAKGYGQFDIEVRTTNAMSLANLAAIVLLFALQLPLNAYVIVFVVVNIGHIVMTARSLRRAGLVPESAPLAPALATRLRNHLGWSVAFALVASFGNRSVETFMLNSYTGAEAVAFFAVAGALTRGGADLLMAGINATLLSAMAHAHGSGDQQRFHRIGADSIRYCHFLGLLLAGVGILWAQPLVVLMYGNAYASAAFLMQVLVSIAGLALSAGAFGAMLSATAHQRWRALVVLVAIFVNAAVAYVLVPRFGLDGALVSHAVGALLETTLMVWATHKVLHVRLAWGSMARTSVAFAVAGLPLFLLHSSADSNALRWLCGGLFGLAFTALTLVLGAWSASDLDVLETLSQRLPAVRPLLRWLQRRSAA